MATIILCNRSQRPFKLMLTTSLLTCQPLLSTLESARTPIPTSAALNLTKPRKVVEQLVEHLVQYGVALEILGGGTKTSACAWGKNFQMHPIRKKPILVTYMIFLAFRIGVVPSPVGGWGVCTPLSQTQPMDSARLSGPSCYGCSSAP